MYLIIDATNIKSGGGLTHLRELLSFDFAKEFGFFEVEVFATQNTLDILVSKDWIKKSTHRFINGNYFQLVLWKTFIFKRYLSKRDCLVFIPGTGFCSRPYVTMCRNLLPLEYKEINRFFFSMEWIRLLVLRFIHLYSYKKAFSVIFLNSYCKTTLENIISLKNVNKNAIIQHGLNRNLFSELAENKNHKEDVLKLIYVSTINLYKHQWELLDVIDDLNEEGYSISITLVGDSNPIALKKLNDKIKGLKNPQFVNYLGGIQYERLIDYYNSSDAFIFASSCETFGMVILEAMTCGLPILCSNSSSMPSTFGDVPIYFDVFEKNSIKDAILSIYGKQETRKILSEKSKKFARNFSWEQTSKETFKYLSAISKELFN